jgi:bacillithiol system protein YtxJ
MLAWKLLTKIEEVDSLSVASNSTPQVIFKHSTRCSISIMAKNRLESLQPPPGILFHYLDLLTYREVSNYISSFFQVYHESPQVLIIKNGECTYVEAHNAITMDDIIDSINA